MPTPVGYGPMFGAAASALSPRNPGREPVRPARSVLLIALTRSSLARLAPVAAELPGPQTMIDSACQVGRWAGFPSATQAALRSAVEIERAVRTAVDDTRPDVVLLAGDSDVALAAALSAS